MIEAAALLSLIRQDWPDFIVVMGLLIYNAIVGFWQDSKAASALAALKQGLALKARVLRDGQWITLDTAALVPGDVVSVAGGETLPADLLLIEGKYLSVDQAALTGESLPVSKGVGDSGYSGSIVRQGTMTALVTATGNATFFGRTAKLVASAGAKSHAEKAVIQMGTSSSSSPPRWRWCWWSRRSTATSSPTAIGSGSTPAPSCRSCWCCWWPRCRWRRRRSCR